MRRTSRVYYIGMIASDKYGKIVGEHAFSGASARKMRTVVEALRWVGQQAIFVSLPPACRTARWPFHRTVVTRDGGAPAIFLATARSRILRKILGSLFLANFARRSIQSRDDVIVYNHALEYLPALIVLRLRGVKVIQDIEDAPVTSVSSVREILGRTAFWLTSSLTDKRKMVVSESVAQRLSLSDYVAVPGVASLALPQSDERKWKDLHEEQGVLKIHYGGTLIADTGVDLFCQAVQRLAESNDRLARRIEFQVTGVGDFGKLRRLQK